MWSYMTGGQPPPASEIRSTTTAAATTDALLATANDNTRLGLAYGMGGTISGGKGARHCCGCSITSGRRSDGRLGT